MNKYEMILSYLLSNEIYLEDEVKHLQQNARFRNIRDLDAVELLIATVRRDTFLEISKHIRDIMNMK